MIIKTRQSTNDEEYLTLLGMCQWVFNSNCSFIIEMIDNEHHGKSNHKWVDLIDLTAGALLKDKYKLQNVLGKDICEQFIELVEMRNAITHSLPTGKKIDGYFVANYRNDKKNKNIIIDKKYLIDFIEKNSTLNLSIHKVRDSYTQAIAN